LDLVPGVLANAAIAKHVGHAPKKHYGKGASPSPRSSPSCKFVVTAPATPKGAAVREPREQQGGEH
jgi:hypothetical protein